MAAPDGNTNASKWTLQATLETLSDIEYYAREEGVYTLRRALILSGVYTGVWSYWKKKWANNEAVMEKIYFIDDIFIDKLESGALTRDLHFGACMFALRVNHRITDKPLKEGERLPEENLPPHLQKQLAIDIEEMEEPAPLPYYAQALPKMYTNIKPTEGEYRKIKAHLYTTYTEDECNEANEKVYAHWKACGGSSKCVGWTLPEEEYVRGKMKMAA